MRSPHAYNTSGTSIRQRFGYYLIGMAVGVVLLGFFTSHREQAVRAQEAARQQAEQARSGVGVDTGSGTESGTGTGTTDVPAAEETPPDDGGP